MKQRLAALCATVGISAFVIVRLSGSPAVDNAIKLPPVDRLAADVSATQNVQPTNFRRNDAEPPATGTIPSANLVIASASEAMPGVKEPIPNASEAMPSANEATPIASEEAPAPQARERTTLAMADPSAIEAVDTAPEAETRVTIEQPISGPAKPGIDSVEILDECLVVDRCIDRYLWALYQRTPKQDTIKQYEHRKVTVRKKRKLVTVTRTITLRVDEDFAWKDPKAADRVGMSMMDYVVGGVDASFKHRVFHLLHAAEEAGLSPGITSAFRDDYRQSIASGLKAADNRSYHGGSSRGGYGHGLAIDVVSVKGETRAQRWISSENLWKWIDAHGKEFGIGRPYLDRDPPHIAPIDGKEYVDHHSAPKVHEASKATKKVAAGKHHHAAKHTRTARSSRSRARTT